MTDDDPLDLAAVAADDAAVERLRTGQPMDDDAVLALLQGLVADVEAGLPATRPTVPVGRGSTVLMLAGEGAPERRWARSGTVVAALAAGVVSLSGVAAASTLVPAGTPLHGFGEAVRAAAGGVTAPTASARPQTATAGAAVAAAARSRAATAQVARLLDQAEALIAGGRTTAATARLDLAQRRLAEVLPAERAPLTRRLEVLRTRLAAQPAAPGKQKPPAEPGQAGPERGKPDRPAPDKSQPKGKARTTAPGPSGSDGGKSSSTGNSEGGGTGSSTGNGRDSSKDSGKGGKGSGSLLGQLSDSDASTKPRA